MKIWQGITLGILGIALLVGIAAYAIVQLTAPARQLNRDFFDALRAGEWTQVEAMAHPSLLADAQYRELRNSLDVLPPFERYFFNQSSWENSDFKGEGTGWTASGCASPLVIERKNGLVTRFSMYELCAN